jgi:glycosyltransferase involved in cell wall biosynthesis
MLLDILIPTYNRVRFLEKNLVLLTSYIRNLGIESDVRILVSNNYSPDETNNLMSRFTKDNVDVNVLYYSQDENIGLEKNAIFCLRESTAKFSMFLGDDDFLDIEYLKSVCRILKEETDVACIIPAIQAIDINGYEVKDGGRDLATSTTRYPSGSDSATKCFQKGHQLSGVVFRRESTLEAYISSDLRNIYPFMFFVGYNCMRGDCIHLTDFPVKVTQPPQENKDWSYGNDGLILERLKNCRALFDDKKIDLYRSEIKILYIDRGHGYRFLSFGLKKFLKFVSSILTSPIPSFPAKCYFFSSQAIIFIKNTLKR